MKWNPYTTSSCPYSIIIYNNSHVAIVGEINEISIGETMVDLGRTLKDNQSEVVIFISSNGGNVVAGNNFIEHIRQVQSQNVTVSCIAQRAISTAFAIYQTCDNQYVTQVQF